MNGRAILPTLTLALLAITAPAPAQRAGSASVVAEAPRWQVGDEWRYSDGRTTRVVAHENGAIVTEDVPDRNCPGCRSVRNAHWAVVAVIGQDGQRFASPGDRELDFPLSVGKEWQFESPREPSRSGMPGASWFQYIHHYRVEAFEEVKTKAGVVKAFRINLRRDGVYGSGVRLPAQLDVWWAPEIRGFVKRKVYAPGWVNDYELVSVALKPVEPPTVATAPPASAPPAAPPPARPAAPAPTPDKSVTREPALPPPAPASPPPSAAGAPADTEAPRIALNYPPADATIDRDEIVVLGLVTDNVAVDRVIISVNGKVVVMSPDSAMSSRSYSIRAPATLHPGENVIEITAVDRAGNGAQLVRTVKRPAVVASPVPRPPEPRHDQWAVVIGIGAYESAGIPRLRYTVSDAEAVYRTLIGPAGFKKDNVILLTDRSERKPTLKNIKWALGTFLARVAKKDDTVLIYFAGHGAPETDPRGIERDGLAKYLIPSDADSDDLYSTAFPMDELQNIFGRIEADRVIAFLDACYSGAAGGRTFASKKTRAGAVDDLFLERLTRSKGRAIITASRPAEVSIELPDLGHGIFTYYLVEGLKGAADLNRDGIVTLQELYEYVEQQVTRKSRSVGGSQHPVMKGELEGVVPLVKVAR